MTSNNGHWTRDDLPSVIKWKSYAGMYLSRLRELEEYADATLDHLNAHYPKPQPYDQGGVRGADSLLYRAERAERERDEARRSLVAKEDEAVSECHRAYRERDEWKARADDLDKHLAKAMSDYQDLEDERDAAVTRAEQAEADAERYSDKFNRAREANRRLADQLAEARTAPAVTRDDIDRALINVTSNAMNYPNPSQMLGKDSGPLRRKCVDAMCDLFGIEAGQAVVDPAVHVVRESDLPAARVDGDYYVVASAKGDYKWPQHGPSWWANRAQDALAKAARYTSLARLAADREATVDPVEAKAIELHQVAYGGQIGFGHATLNAQEMFRSLARHFLGLEAAQ